MKQLISILLALIVSFPVLASNYSAISRTEEVPVFLNKNLLSFETPPFVKEGRVIVPVRTISEALNADVSWDNNSMSALISLGNKKVSFEIGKEIMLVNGKSFEIDSPAVIKNNTTFVPLRALSEALGFDVSWNGATSTVIITSYPVAKDYMIPRTYYVKSGCYEGCIIACKAMVLSNHFDKQYAFEEVLELNGGQVYANWSPEFCENVDWKIVFSSELELKEASGDWAFSNYTVPEKLSLIYDALENSSGIIAQFIKDSKPHGVVITGYTSDNELIVCDPDTASETPENTLISDSCLANMYQLYSTKELLPYLVSMRAIEK